MWGSQNWGEMIWGGHVVPSLPIGGLLLLMGLSFLAGGYFLRPEGRSRRSYLIAAVLVAIPLSVGALTLPHTFVNGSIADATEVNGNFSAIATSLAVESCPFGMTRIDMPHSVLCYERGVVGNWEVGDNNCDAQFRARICTLQQWRAVVCRAGVSNPGNSWTDAHVGPATFGTISGCSGDQVDSALYVSQRVAPCCLEWPRY
jgi:hypothetical protein